MRWSLALVGLMVGFEAGAADIILPEGDNDFPTLVFENPPDPTYPRSLINTIDDPTKAWYLVCDHYRERCQRIRNFGHDEDIENEEIIRQLRRKR